MTREASVPPELERLAGAELGTPPSQAELVIRERIKAEWEDYRRRLNDEMEEHEVKARETMMLDFLEVADNLERAVAAWNEGGTKSPQSMQDGIEAVLRLFRSKLERYAVTAIEAEGERFDPRLHHAVSQSTSTDTTPGTVLQELQRGYRIDGRLLRPAAVVVASAPAKATESDTPNGADGVDGAEAAPQADALPHPWRGYQRNRR